MRLYRTLACAACFIGGVSASLMTGCGSDDNSTFKNGHGLLGGIDGGGAGGGLGGNGVGDGGGTGPVPCVNLCKQQVSCPAGGTTTLTGTVYAPTPAAYGTPDPLYNAIVYVPNATLQDFPAGASCDQCGTLTSGEPLVSALTGPDGTFTLTNVPVGNNIPLVIQLGRWRRVITIPTVSACQSTPLTADQTRLPRTQKEGSPFDNIPLFAVSTGSADALECVLRKVGIADSEFTLPGGTGRVQLFDENGSSSLGGQQLPASNTSLYNAVTQLTPYDVTVFDCEGGQNDKPAAAQQNVIDYTTKGGRVFASHYSYVWLYNDPPFQGTASWVADSMHPTNNDAPLTANIDTSFPKGMAFAQWLGNVNALSAPDQIQIHVPRHDLNSAVAPAQQWIYANQTQPSGQMLNAVTTPTITQHYTFNTPVGADPTMQCGRVVFSDFHVTSATSGVSSRGDVLQNCDMVDPGPMSAQEKVLEFMLFDLANCIQSDQAPPKPPPAVK